MPKLFEIPKDGWGTGWVAGNNFADFSEIEKRILPGFTKGELKEWQKVRDYVNSAPNATEREHRKSEVFLYLYGGLQTCPWRNYGQT